MKCWEKVDPLANRATLGARTPDILSSITLTNPLNLSSFVLTAPSSLLCASSRRFVYTWDDEEGETGNGGKKGSVLKWFLWIINVHQSDENQSFASRRRRPHQPPGAAAPSGARKVATSTELLCIVPEDSGSISWVGSLQDIKEGGGVFCLFSFPFLHPTSSPHPDPSAPPCPAP